MIRSRLCSSLVALLVLACVLGAAAPAFAKDYHITSIDMAAGVQPNGDMTITEKREVEFNGSFHWAQWALNTKGSKGIELESITGPDGQPMQPATQSEDGVTPPPGTYLLTEEADRVLVKVGFDVTDRTVPFVLKYRVLEAAKRYADTAELYWQFIGTETDVRTDKVHVAVLLPAGASKADVKAWAHGPLQGMVAIQDTRGAVAGAQVTLDVTDLRPNTFVEGRILFPADALSNAPVIDQPRKAAVEAEEAKLANEANAARRRAKAVVGLAWIGGVGLPLLLLGIVVFLWWKYGREYKPTEVQGEYYREVPEGVSVPLVGALWRMGQPDDHTIGAVLMDLSLQGRVYMRPVTLEHSTLFGAKQEPTYELTLLRDKLGGMDPLEWELVWFLFEQQMGRDTFTIAELRDHAKAHPQSFTQGVSKWKTAVANKAENDLHWIEAKSRTMQVLSIGLAVLAAICTILALVGTQSGWFVLGFVPAVAAFVLALQVKRRSHEAVELYAKYEGLRNYLRDFSRLDERPPEAIALWEQYLVIAVVFGIAEQVIAQMKVVVPQVVNDPAFATAYWWASPVGYGDHSSPVGSVTTGFAAAVSAANSAMSSSSGGGGGFSGGGGGGGGGGGFSAG